MKKLKKIVISLWGALLLMMPVHIQANASIRMPSTAYVGDTISVTISVPGNSKSWAYAVRGAVSAEPMGFEGDPTTNTYTFKASKEGTYTVSVEGQYSDGVNDYIINTSASVTVVKRPTNNGGGSSRPSTPSTTTPAQEPQEDPRSKNYDLSSLSVDQGTLTPEFSSDVTEYRVHLPKDATSITVSAKAEDAAATVIGTGKKELQAGDNTIEVTCRSEYGTEQVYTIHVYVEEEPLVYLDHDGKSLGVVRNTQDVTIPDGFKESKTTIDDTQITVWTNENMHATIVYLIDEEDQKGFYLLEDGKVTSSFVPVSIAGRTLYQIDVPSDQRSLAGMQFQTVTIKDLELSGWVFDDPDLENFCVIYVMNEKGERAYYQYDSAEETLQRFNGMSIDADAYASVQNMQYVGFGLAAAFAIAAIALGAWTALRLRKPKKEAR